MTVVRRGAAAVVALVVASAVLLATAGPASAHPLGNFTINRYARVEVSAGVARVHYVLDLAEIPAFQVRDEVDDPDAFAREQVEEIRTGLTLEVDGAALPFESVDHRLARPQGEAGLPTLRLDVVYEAPLPRAGPDEQLTARFVDANGGGRIGWREVVVVALGDARIDRSSVPATDLSDALRTYPDDRLRSPLAVQEAQFRFRQGSEAVAAAPIEDEAGGRIGDFFTDLVDRQDITPLVLAGMLGLAALAGAGHALAPGHGKTVMAAYLIGTRGRPIDAVLLGVIVSAMHTTSVLLLGVALYQVDQNIALEGLYPALTLVSGIGVLVVGVWLAVTRVRAFRAGAAPGDHEHEHEHDHDHSHVDDHDHDHEHERGHGHGQGPVDDHDRQLVAATPAAITITGPAGTDQRDAGHGHDGGPRAPHHGGNDHDHGSGGHRHGPGGHSHELPEGVAPLSRRGLVLLATAGGVVPSPSAVIVLVSAFTLGRIGLGLVLVAAFSIGLAATLTAVGLALVVGSQALGDRLSTRLVRVFPLLGATVLLVLGLVLVVRGVIDL